jgi:hypothetical protein
MVIICSVHPASSVSIVQEKVEIPLKQSYVLDNRIDSAGDISVVAEKPTPLAGR